MKVYSEKLGNFIRDLYKDTREIADPESRFLEICLKFANSEFWDLGDCYVYDVRYGNFAHTKDGTVLTLLEIFKEHCLRHKFRAKTFKVNLLYRYLFYTKAEYDYEIEKVKQRIPDVKFYRTNDTY